LSFGVVLDYVFVFFKVVAFFVDGNGAVFDGAHRAVADARHAVGTVFAPNGLFVLYLNVV
jgi:hypothetical protein